MAEERVRAEFHPWLGKQYLRKADNKSHARKIITFSALFVFS